MASFNTSAIVDTFMQSTTAAEARAALEIVATLESYDFIDPAPMAGVTLSKADIAGKIVYGVGDVSSELVIDDDFVDDDFFYYIGIIGNNLDFAFPLLTSFETIGACNVNETGGLTVPPNVLCLFLLDGGIWRVCALAGSDFTKQDVLVSGTSIKTVNNESLLGSGNLVIAGAEYSDITTLNAGEDVSYGDWVCLEDDGKWWLADASGTAGSTHMVGRVVTSANANSIVQVRVQGPFSDSGLTVGSGPYYLSATTPGAMTATAPSGPGQVVRVVGYATQSASFYVDPDKTWATIPTTPGEGQPVELLLAASDETSDLTIGTAKITFRMPFAMTLSSARASVGTAPTGAAIIVDINEAGTSIFSTRLTIDATEKTSTTAETAAVISDSALADDAEITVDIDQVGSTVAGKGLKVLLKGVRA